MKSFTPRWGNIGAFTLIELMIVIVIMAVLTTALAISFPRMLLNVRYDDQLSNVQRIIEEARGYALSDYLVDDTASAEYYLLLIKPKNITLMAVDADKNEEELESYEFLDGFSMDSTLRVFYFPPDGNLCFSKDCSDGATEETVVFEDDARTYSTALTISVYGGYLEVE